MNGEEFQEMLPFMKEKEEALVVYNPEVLGGNDKGEVVEPEICQEDIIAEGALSVEAAIFRHASLLEREMEKEQKIIDYLNGFVLDIEKVTQLDSRSKMDLHHILHKHRESDRAYLLNIHSTMSASLNHLREIDKIRADMVRRKKKSESALERKVGTEMRQLVLNEIRRRVEEKIKAGGEKNA